jgi:DNA-binding GntR family transcriptional regulator
MQTSALEIDIPLAELAYRQLKSAIVQCEFEPEQRLRVEELGRRYELSNTPIREALCRLVEQGLVKSLDNRGFRVAPITPEGMKDLTRVRLLIETEALRDSMIHGGDAWEIDMVAQAHALALIEKRLEHSPVSLDNHWSDRHRAFHLSLYSGCTSPMLKEMVHLLFDRAERYRRYSASQRIQARAKNDEHTELLNCILSKNVNAAVDLLKKHIESTQHSVIEALQKLNDIKHLII